jgi:hypothetical protein
MHKTLIKISLLRAFIILTILVKLCFFYFVIRTFYITNFLKNKLTNEEYKILLEMNDRIKHQLEFIFTILMAILLIILFNPINSNMLLDNEARTLLYLFGFLLILTANWDHFIQF